MREEGLSRQEPRDASLGICRGLEVGTEIVRAVHTNSSSEKEPIAECELLLRIYSGDDTPRLNSRTRRYARADRGTANRQVRCGRRRADFSLTIILNATRRDRCEFASNG